MMATLPITLDDRIVKKIDILVRKGLYKNRTEAIRDQILKGLDNLELIELPSLSKKHKKLIDQLLKKKTPPLILKSQKSAVDLVAEGRER